MSNEATDPIEYFLQDMTFHGKSKRTRVAYERVLREFEAFLESESPDATPESATQRHCLAWVHSIRGTVASSTVATYASYLHRFYAYMAQVGEFDANPMALVMEELDETIDTDPTRREVSLEKMRAFLGAITHPLDRAVLTCLVKTGLRVGELCNLDLRDLSLDAGEWSSDGGVQMVQHHRGSLDERPNSLFVEAGISRGEKSNGELRSASNKRKRDTIVPVDGELQDVLCRWLAIRPDARSDAAPLFVSTRDRWGARLTPQMVRSSVETYARDAGWYDTGGGASENVTPHYFRHFFTTHLRDRTGDRGVVKYLRGDVADDVLETYTHNWGDRVRAVYTKNIYKLH